MVKSDGLLGNAFFASNPQQKGEIANITDNNDNYTNSSIYQQETTAARPAVNVYEMVNQRIEEQLLKGTIPWRRPWDAKFSFPRSLSTGKEYKGINMFLLASLSYSSPWFGTFNEIKSRGEHVKPNFGKYSVNRMG